MSQSRPRWIASRAGGVLLAVSLLLGPAGAQPAAAPDAQAGEAQIKAAFICKFGNYVEWPARAAARTAGAFVIGAAADEKAVAQLVHAAAANTVNGRPIQVRRIEPGDPIEDVDVIFVARGHTARLSETLAAARGLPILTVTDLDDAPVTGIVNFVIVDDRVRFDIALQPAERNNLKISGRLLALARKVTGRPS